MNYFTDDKNTKTFLKLTGLAEDELEHVVGRFRKDHYRFAGQLKGYYLEKGDQLEIRHHFTKKLIAKFEHI